MPSSTSPTTSSARPRAYDSNPPSRAPGYPRGVLLQFGAHRCASLAREVRQLNPRLLDLTAQRDGPFGFRQPPPAQDVLAPRAQRRHPRFEVGPSTVGLVSADDVLQPGFPGPQPVSVFHIGIIEPLAQQVDEFVEVRFTQIGRRRHRHPGHVGIAGSARRQQRTVGGQHVAPVAVRVDLRHHPDHQVGVLGRQIDQGAIGFGHRRNRRHHEHHRCGGIGRTQLVGLDEGALGHAFAQCGDQAGGAGQPRSGHQHDIAALHARRVQARIDRRDQGVRQRDRIVGHPGRALRRRRSEPREISAAQLRRSGSRGAPA